MFKDVHRTSAGMGRWPGVWNAGPMRLHVLGPLELCVHGRSLGLGGSRGRALVALLAANVGRVTSVGALVDGLWGLDPR
jgi:DNA-binding SARP family transcriptional activator